MGHLIYANRPDFLKIYTFARVPVELRPIRIEWLENSIFSKTTRWTQADEEIQDLKTRGGLTDEEMERCVRQPQPGKCFELNYQILHRLLTLRKLNTEAGGCVRMRVRGKAGKEPNPKNPKRHLIFYWSDELEADVSPNIDIVWEDLRVDRQELLQYLRHLKDLRAAHDVVSKAMETVVQPEEPEERVLNGKSASSHMRFMAALLKALNVGDIRQTTNVARQLEAKVEEISESGPRLSWIEDRLRELSKEGFADSIKRGPESKSNDPPHMGNPNT